MDSGPLALQDLADIRRQLRALGAGPGHEQRVLRLWAQALPQDSGRRRLEDFLPAALRTAFCSGDRQCGNVRDTDFSRSTAG